MRPTRATPEGRAYLDMQNLARRTGRTTQALLTEYVLERFLARLAASPYSDRFILKGGLLLAALDARRATVDADLMVRRMELDAETILEVVRAIGAHPLAEVDGVGFQSGDARTRIIRDGDQYSGVRVTMNASISTAQVKLQLDISTGDPITPGPQHVTLNGLRPELPAVVLLGYPVTTVLAEKLCTAVALADANTRVRDYADVWMLIHKHTLDAATLGKAIRATANHRAVVIRPLGDVLTDLAETRSRAYVAYRRGLGPGGEELPGSFITVVDDVMAFFDPVAQQRVETATWDPATSQWVSAQRV